MSYDGLYFDQLPKEIQEALAAEEGAKAEEDGLEREYGDQIRLHELVDKRNKAIIEGNMQTYQELTEEMFGDV